MGTILLSAFCALALNVQSAEIKKDTINKYVIDKQVIEQFNGTQLEGKTISKYIIAYKDAGNVVEKMHVIMTKGKENIDLKNKSISQMKYEGLVIVDGKEMDTNEFSKMNAEEIVSMQVYKAGSKVAQSYGEKGENGVLRIVTKANKAPVNVYFLDRQRVEKNEIDKLSPNKIASITVNKKEGNSVIEVVTKK